MTRKKENSRQQHAEKIPQNIQGTLVILEVTTFRKYIGSSKYEVNISNCSGFFVGRNQIATSFHVLEGAMSVAVKHVDTDTAYTIAGITAFDEKNDLAVLKVSEEGIPSYLEYNRGVAYQAGEDFEGALAAYNEAINLNPDIPNAYKARQDAAKANFEEATRINGDLAKNYYEEGRGKNRGRAYEAAMDSFDKAIRLNPEYAAVYSNRALSQNALGRRELRRKNPEKAKYYLRGSIADCTEAIRLNPKYTAAYNNRGVAKRHLGHSEADCGNSEAAETHYHAAIADLDKAIQLNPKHVKAHRNRGYVKEKLCQQEAAEADFQKAKALDSTAQAE